METIKIMVSKPREAIYKELHIFDSMDDYLEFYNKGKDFVRTGFQNWKKNKIEGKIYYSYDYNDDAYITEKLYKKILNECKKSYLIRERNLVRTQKNSNCRSTGSHPTKEAVMKYMRDDVRSWLPTVYSEIDAEISSYQAIIDRLHEEKRLLQDDDYLKSKIEIEYEFDSTKYRERNGK